ncbi:hypothetical protein LTR70_009318 [Exophiala xenobiotica]|uniref:Histidine acid phosphatase n=1 Tax=Lithohypha guttulata TaxID=1690604 RepID=A0ABR0K099_9EURO|nr:hypothetical protein LTR24_008328 [Lithohypha guttulata]KAK5310633.1 hypothetical protein LTR70_009318 [Exophiala xenobiotica]
MRHFGSVAVAALLLGSSWTTAQSTNTTSCPTAPPADLNWYPPTKTVVNDLESVLNGTNIYGYIFNSSTTPLDVPYSTYNWCNMPHTRANEYIIPDPDFELRYVEVIHRHHKRTPYASNTFPQEQYPWLCNDESLYYYAAPSDNSAAQIVWNISQSPLNPFKPTGFPNSTCQFPQITAGGLLDSRQHGADVFSVYHDLLSFLPSTFDADRIFFRVTNNVITSQVAAQVAVGMYPSLDSHTVPVTVQPVNVDSLEPQYPCPASESLYSSYGVGSTDPAWLAHLTAPSTTQLFARLDALSGVNPSDTAWHAWFDHYFDNLSARLCHDKPLPCNSSVCVSDAMTESVFRRGIYEYSYIYRDNPHSLSASVASYGVWLAELAYNIRTAMAGTSNVVYRHNVAHDGSMSRLLSMLQVDVMVWPGMGSEVVFELWRRKSSGCWVVRVLWKGVVLRSSNPGLGALDMVPVGALLGYIDGLVGVNAREVPGLCAES